MLITLNEGRMVKSLMLLIRLDDSRVDNTEGNSKSGSIQYSLPVFFLSLVGKLHLMKDFRFRSLYYSKKKNSKC